MRRACLLSLTAAVIAGCRTCSPPAEPCVEARVAAVVPVKATPQPIVQPADPPSLPAQPQLGDLWSVAIDFNPALREAAADWEGSLGQVVQAGLYLNPDITYQETGLGDSRNGAGTLNLFLRQEIITANKLKLAVAAAARGSDVAYLALVNRKFEVLGRIRRAYFDYIATSHVLEVNDEVVTSLVRDTETTRTLVEDVKSRPPVDLVRMKALLEDAKAFRALAAATYTASWKQLAAEVGVPDLPPPPEQPLFLNDLPALVADDVTTRVLSANTELQRLAMRIEQARAELSRAEVAAVPNVTIGAGYQNQFTVNQPGGIVNVQVPLPVWDRKQGLVQESQARIVQAAAALQSARTRLCRDIAEALGRYLGLKEQEDRLTREVLPLLVDSLKAVQELYEGGDPKRSFTDVLLAQQNLNATKLRRAEVRRLLLQAFADLQTLMQLDVDEPPAP